jgi:hypothetical protein
MITDKHESATSYADEAMSSMGDYFHRGTDQVSDIIDDRPGGAMMVACLAGFGVGLLLSQLFAQEERSYSYSAFDRGTAERFGRNLLEKVERAMPAMVRDRLGK